MSAPLIRYDAARAALAEAHRVDEATAIDDRALAVSAYARQVKDYDMIRWVTEIKLRAECRMGELLNEMAKHPGSSQPGVGRRGKNAVARTDRIPILKSLGITKDQSATAQQLAAIPEAEFEGRIAEVGDNLRGVTAAAVQRERRPVVTHNPVPPEERIWDAVGL